MLAKRRIGLLGGSFNPAHAGHAHISQEALKRLKLDEVWWLVSPQNPLKPSAGMADYTTRLQHAQRLPKHARVRVLDIEAREGLFYSIDTLRHLTRRYPNTQFVWLMGADNLAHFHRWRAWRAIATLVPIAVLDRAPYALRALNAPFARLFRMRRLSAAQAMLWSSNPPPCWIYLTVPRHPLSATQLRKMLGNAAFMRHS